MHYTLEEAKLAAVGKIDGEKRDARYGPGESHGIPYRALLPQGVKNVIVSGRSISCDKRIQGSVRVMPVCLAMGEAAGMAAAFAASDSGDVHAVDVQKLRDNAPEERRIFPLKFHVTLPRGMPAFRAGCAAHRCGNGRIHPAIGRNCI